MAILVGPFLWEGGVPRCREGREERREEGRRTSSPLHGCRDEQNPGWVPGRLFIIMFVFLF